MFSYLVSAVSSRTDHPILFSTFLLAGVFLVAGFVVDSTTGNGVASGFFAIYAGFAAVLGIAGYAVLFAAKGISIIRERSGPVA